jgi:peptidoglycan hydrolase-like protein with peptidoglycan-binding domain
MTSLPLTVGARVVTGLVAAFALAISSIAPSALLPTAAAAATAKAPATPIDLPTSIEPLTGYVPATSCNPVAKPGAAKLGKLLTSSYPGTSYGIDRTCGVDPLPTTEHYEGRAVDWMVSVRKPKEAAQANAVIKWLLATDSAGNKYANARRLGVMYIIWNNKIWGAYSADRGWRAYSSCSTQPSVGWDSSCHRNHVHISLSWEGAMGRTSFWSKELAAPDYGPCRPADLNWAAPYKTANSARCISYPRVTAPKGASSTLKTLTTFSGMELRVGSTGPVVKAVQRSVGITADGRYGPATKAAVNSWQTAHQIKATGVVNATTWRALLKANAPKPVTAATAKPAPTPTTKPASTLTKYKTKVLKVGSRGAAVKALQKRLRITADGWFGPQTKAAVQAFQRSHGIKSTGVVTKKTWTALGA